MLIEVLKSKIHRVPVTQTHLDYIGITIDEDYMDEVNLLDGEKVQVLNINNGERIETYVVKGERGTKIIGINDSAARKFLVGNLITIISYAHMDFENAKHFKPLQLIF
jgi:aspartate 1-decarboxylase